MSAARFLVSGHVQGVFFRASTRTEALRLNLVGYANNLPDGRVEVFAQGSNHAVDRLEQWLEHGPPLARVTTVERETVDEEDRDGFVTG
jgi:acylphosphatase